MRPVIAPALLLCFLATPLLAQEDEKNAPLKLTDRGARILERYQPNGEKASCVDISHIQSTRVLGQQAILFELRGGRTWLNRLDNRCPMLTAHEQFSYTVSTTQLCSTDIITVLMRDSGPGSSCGLGVFEGYEKKPKEE